jgi:hypothetical protein
MYVTDTIVCNERHAFMTEDDKPIMVRNIEAIRIIHAFKRRRGIRTNSGAAHELLRTAGQLGLHRRDLTKPLIDAAISQGTDAH